MSDRGKTDPQAQEPAENGFDASDRNPLQLPEPGVEAFSPTEVRAGIFVLVAVVILGFFYFFGKDVLSLFQPHKNMVVYFNDISGLEEGAAVRYAGMTVGKVTDIRIVEGKDHKIEVDLDVLEAVPLREGTVASIRATELVIGKYVDLTGGDPGSPLLRDDAVLAGSQEPTLDEVINSAGRIILNLRDIVEEVSVIFREQSVETLMTNLNRMAELAAGEDQGILVNLKKALQTMTDAGVVEEFITITRAISDNKDRIVDLMGQANRLAIDTNRMMLGHERQISSLLNDLSRMAGAFGNDAESFARNLNILAASASSVSGDLPGLVRNTQSLLGKMEITLNALNKILSRTENIDENDVREFLQHEGMRIYFTEGQAPKRMPGPEGADPKKK